MPEPGATSDLRQSLERLHAQLSAASQLDEGSRQLLREVLTDIERLLPQGGPESMQPLQAAPHRLEALAVGFETDHPALAASLRQFIDLLGRAGV